MNPTQKSLAEQMQIHDLEIARRKELLGFTKQDGELLAACSGHILDKAEALVKTFYHKQTAINEIAVIIGDADTLARLRSAMTRYVIDLFSGNYGEEYVNNRLRIGLVHKRIGVAPKYYLSAMRILKSLLMDILGEHLANKPYREETLQALDKLLYFDNELVFDTYIRSLLSEIESAKDKAVQYALSLEQQVAERTRELEQLSRQDPLTNLYNQRFFMETLSGELARAQRTATPLALLYFDVDNFKQINDQTGHLAGDEVLRSIAAALLAECRTYDTCCRYGGDEFCVLLPGTDAQGAQLFAERLLARLAKDSLATSPSLSIGIAQNGPQTWLDPLQFISCADQHMYAAKRQGGGRIAKDDEERLRT
ncbi:GGDEF domain-containing protein [Pseudomonas sp. MAP12]|uniref:diguanylate cyclase n=1 Tax=Geopseudomonas aromaticivorans TaxID=2849492 RepID=A0ABS6N1S7_9GAMM|nr:GGDEF domain-containing protein [Pseudomonas aromaticivorans]MBV2134988.1 GGDEF domain-containing protein [Pseudomonas aromaticivorans]